MVQQTAGTYHDGHIHPASDNDEDQGAFQINTDPIPPQPPLPSKTMDWELSWSRTYRWMRLRDPETDQFWFTKQMVGKGRMVGTDCNIGRMYMRCRAQMVGEQVFLYYPKEGATQMNLDEMEGQKLPDSHWRLCYHRAGRDWRLRNERTGELTFVKDYVGNLVVNWKDQGSHIFHDGSVILDKNGVAHFVDQEVEAKKKVLVV